MKKFVISSFAFALVALIVIQSCTKNNIKPSSKFEFKEHQDVFAADYSFTNGTNGNNHGVLIKNVDNQKAAIGRLLFYDPRLSLNGTTACANCHKQELGFADNTAGSVGFVKGITPMNSISLCNTGSHNILFWKARAKSLTELALMPVSNHLEMGFINEQDVVTSIGNLPMYQNYFNKVYGTQNISKQTISECLAEFITSLQSYNSKYDISCDNNFLGQSNQPFRGFTDMENRGKDLFFGKYNCGSCHGVTSQLNLGWSEETANIGLEEENDPTDAMNGNVKVPSLRNVMLSGPYMHDGRFATIDDVLEHYSHGIKNNPSLNWNFMDFDSTSGTFIGPKKLNISESEREDLKAFLHTLTDYKFISDRRFSNPFKP